MGIKNKQKLVRLKKHKNIKKTSSLMFFVSDAPLTKAIEHNPEIRGIIAPTEHSLFGFAKGGLIRSRFLKMLIRCGGKKPVFK